MKITPTQRKRLTDAASKQFAKYYSILERSQNRQKISKSYSEMTLKDINTKLKFYNYICDGNFSAAHRLYDDIDSIAPGHDLSDKVLELLCKAANCITQTYTE